MENPNQSIKKTNPSPSIDAIPDEILILILSFLPTKTSVSTSILARRWRFLWAQVPNLHLTHNRRELRIDTIYRKVLLHYEVRAMNLFLLHSDDARCSRPHLKACIDFAIDRNVKQIDLRLHFPNCFPSSIFACNTLVDIKLSGHGSIPTTDFDICLPALKKLYLSQVRFECPKSLPHLLAGCPVLEELTVHRQSADVSSLVVPSGTINRLDINSCFGNTSRIGFTAEIDAPAVRYLVFRDVVSSEVSAGQLDSLIEADVCLDNQWIPKDDEDSNDDESVDESGDWGFGVVEYRDYGLVERGVVDDDAVANYVSDGDDGSLELEFDSDDDDSDDSDDSDEVAYMEEEAQYARSVLEFVSRLSNVKSLKLTTRHMDVPDSDFSTWIVKFYNLTKLELRGDWRFIPNFLENADNLEDLTICGDDIEDDLKQWIEPEEVPPCLVSHLGIFRIFSFGCEDQEFLMMEYILRNANVLKRVEVHFKGGGDDLGKNDEAVKKISLFPMGSVDCEFEFC